MAGKGGGKGGTGSTGGTATIKGTSRSDVLYGTDGDDTIDGGTGSDTMVGGRGNDLYYADRLDDVVVEKSGEGIDTVYAVSDYTLSANVENLTLSGTKAVVGTGNDLDNVIVGNAIANTLSGGAGDDTITGAGGNDSIDGGAGSDTAVFSLKFTDYALTLTAVGLQVRALSGGDGVDLLKAIEYLRFADRTIMAPINHAPVATDDANSTVADTVIAGNVLANDSDPDGQILSVAAINGQAASVGQPITLASGARLTLGADGGYTYDPTSGGLGDGRATADSFTYTVTDGAGGAATATVMLSVLGGGEPSPQPAPYYVQDLLLGDTARWNYPDAPGTPVTVAFTFLDQTPDYYNPTDWACSGFRGFTDQQRGMTRDALADIESYANIRFVEVADASQAAITFGIADVPYGVGCTYAPDSSGVGALPGDVWLYSGYAGDSFTLGSSPYKTLLHEIGHSIGLDHPSTLTGDEGSRMYTVMSYTHHPYALEEPETHMVYDVAAVQYLYGANLASRTGDDVYGLANLSDKILTIWDAGGNDTIDVAAATAAVVLDLRAGQFSTVASWGADNVAIAYGTTIENAVGGAGADTLIGNAADNRLAGGAGNDLVTGGAGRDVFAFGTGSGRDQVTDFVRGEDLIDLRGLNLAFANLSIAASGGDTVVTFGASQITLLGLTQLDATDFLL